MWCEHRSLPPQCHVQSGFPGLGQRNFHLSGEQTKHLRPPERGLSWLEGFQM